MRESSRKFGQKRAVVEGVAWGHRLRALKRLLNGARAVGRCILVSGLSTVLKGIANDEVSEWSITSAEVAAAASSRPDGVTGDLRGCATLSWMSCSPPCF